MEFSIPGHFSAFIKHNRYTNTLQNKNAANSPKHNGSVSGGNKKVMGVYSSGGNCFAMAPGIVGSHILDLSQIRALPHCQVKAAQEGDEIIRSQNIGGSPGQKGPGNPLELSVF